MCRSQPFPREGVTTTADMSSRFQNPHPKPQNSPISSDVNAMASPNAAPATLEKKTNNRNRRRRSRPTPKNKNSNIKTEGINITKPHHPTRSDDVSTASTAPSSDDSFSSDSCSSPQRKRFQNSRRSATATKNSDINNANSHKHHPSSASSSPKKNNKKSPSKKSTPPKKSTSKNTNSCNKKTSPKSKPSKQPPHKPATITLPQITPEEKSQYVALDAEMVGIGPFGHISALARVSLVNWEGEVLFDTMVRVPEPVTDYRTFVSGITPQDLEGPDVLTFEECQSRVEEIIRGKILVGHGLKNDLRVLNLSHPWYDVRDTAKYEPFMKHSTEDETVLVAKKLKVLAKDKLGMAIQEEGMSHCPVEDAVAAMELYKKHRVKWEKSVEWKMERTEQIVGQ
mmetsp:Transcript_3442/g.8039  ORF Transcript_3442/g.8039 Transcript_3442/m.8039 type:complete len:397 (-) Transcript_3442:191-1381(-)